MASSRIAMSAFLLFLLLCSCAPRKGSILYQHRERMRELDQMEREFEQTNRELEATIGETEKRHEELRKQIESAIKQINADEHGYYDELFAFEDEYKKWEATETNFIKTLDDKQLEAYAAFMEAPLSGTVDKKGQAKQTLLWRRLQRPLSDEQRICSMTLICEWAMLKQTEETLHKKRTELDERKETLIQVIQMLLQ